MYPFSYKELSDEISPREAKRSLHTRLIYGSYPDVVNHPGKEKEILIELVQSYLYKDILALASIRKPAHIEKILRALAFQVGSEVSYNELAQTLSFLPCFLLSIRPLSFHLIQNNFTDSNMLRRNFYTFILLNIFHMFF